MYNIWHKKSWVDNYVKPGSWQDYALGFILCGFWCAVTVFLGIPFLAVVEGITDTRGGFNEWFNENIGLYVLGVMGLFLFLVIFYLIGDKLNDRQ